MNAPARLSPSPLPPGRRLPSRHRPSQLPPPPLMSGHRSRPDLAEGRCCCRLRCQAAAFPPATTRRRHPRLPSCRAAAPGQI
uniref:Uncharacterized protein n=1 Tax=Oryza rufipogon TaxID=4529 RepID=A0A0E0Q6T7_ORYRU